MHFLGRLLFVCLLFSSLAPAQSLAGRWIFSMDGDDTPQRVTIKEAADSSFTGNVYGQDFKGLRTGNDFKFNVGSYAWEGSIREGELKGVLGTGRSAWRATRIPERREPRTFDLAPAAYSRHWTAAAAPALKLNPGDSVRTSTVDASGRDGKGARVTRPGNPLTGPFVVESALPGDVLVVRIKRVEANRDWGFSGYGLMENTLDSGYLQQRKPAPNDWDNHWDIDRAARVIRPRAKSPGLSRLAIPYAPFLGCIGVAPGSATVRSSRDSGPFGGNMEYRFVRTGTTVYLPVNEIGAHLWIGDGHAAQGDGELTGDAIEISMDVEFEVDLLESPFWDRPRFETAEELMTMGVAGSTDEAIRQSTSDMARWLESRFKLTSAEAAVVLGTMARYDIPDLVGPHFGVALRLPKSALPAVEQ